MFAPVGLVEEGGARLSDDRGVVLAGEGVDEWAWLFDPLGDAWWDPADEGAEPGIEVDPQVEGLPAPWQSAACLAAVTPGAGLAAVLERVDLASADDELLVETVAAGERQAALGHLQAALAAAVLSRRASMRPHWHVPAPINACVAGDELAMRLGWSRPAANRLVRDGRALENELLLVADAVRDGLLDTAKLRVLTDRLHERPGPLAWAVQEAVLPQAATRTPTQLAADIDRALLAVDPVDAALRLPRAIASRHVCHPRRLPDGMAGLWAVLPATDAARIDGTLEATARTARAAGDPRTLDQLRADTLTDLATGTALLAGATSLLAGTGAGESTGAGATTDTAAGAAARSGAGAAARSGAGSGSGGCDGACREGANGTRATTAPARTAHGAGQPVVHADDRGPEPNATADDRDHADQDSDAGRESQGPSGAQERPPGRAAPGIRIPKVRIDVTVALSTLLGLDDNPAELAGLGPIPAEQARALALGGTWRRIVTDPLTGAVLDVGRSRYRPPAAIAEHVIARDGVCAAPGCSVPGHRCDLDHTTEYHGTPANGSPHQGTTSADNLGPLSNRCHRLKTDGGFTLTQIKPGVFEWHTPAGLAYRVTPGQHGHTEKLDKRRPSYPDTPPF